MRDWLTIDVVLATLLVTSFTSVGLLALWAATSPRHWFLRTAVVLAFLLPLLLIPAYEAYLVFALQAGVVVASVKFWHRWHRESTPSQPDLSHIASPDEPPAAMQFSLMAMLLTTALVAVTVFIAVRLVDMPPQNAESWTSIFLNGLVSAVVVLLGAGLAVSGRKRVAVPAAVVASLLLAGLLLWQDWFVFSIIERQWLPDPSYWRLLQQTSWQGHPLVFWWRATAIYLTTVVCTLLVISLLSLLWRKRPWRTAAVFGLIALLPAYIVLRLLQPMLVPHVALPKSNGWDDLVAAGNAIQAGSPILNTSVEPTSTQQLAAEVAKFAASYDRIRLGLARRCEVPIWPPNGNVTLVGDLRLNDIQGLRAVARALMREGELAQQEGRFRDAARIALDNIRVGQASTRGGLLTHYLVGNAIAGIGHASLREAIPHLAADTCREMIQALENFEGTREPLSKILVRDRIWDENAYGWHGHLLVLVDDLTAGDHSVNAMVRYQVLPRTQAASRLLVLELALRQYELRHGRLPRTLRELAPEFLDRVPADPFDPDSRPLRYAQSAGVYLLYSVGLDADDDGGRPPAKDEFGNRDLLGDGDLSLDVFFPPEEPADNAESADASGSM